MTVQGWQAVIFDLDDTLVRTIEAKWAHHKAVAQQFYGIDLTDDDIRTHWGKPFDQLIRILYRDADSLEAMRTANRSLEDTFPKPIYAGAREVVEDLLTFGLRIGVVTSTNRAFVISDLTRLAFPISQFLFVQAADETHHHKPDPRVFDPALAILRRNGISPSETVYVGDSLLDFEAATGAGIDFIAVTTGLADRTVFEAVGARMIIEKITELREIIVPCV